MASGSTAAAPGEGTYGDRGTPGREAEEVPRDVSELLAERGCDHVTYVGWQAIDRAEVAAGEPHGRPRIKFCRLEEMLDAARSGDTVAS